MVADELVPARPDDGWQARYRVDPEGEWAGCRLVEISLTGARVELDGPPAVDGPTERAFHLQIDSIAEDEVGITMRAAVLRVEPGPDGRPVADVEFAARREERLLLHLLVRLHELA